jgi:hypothetical protein
MLRRVIATAGVVLAVGVHGCGGPAAGSCNVDADCGDVAHCQCANGVCVLRLGIGDSCRPAKLYPCRQADPSKRDSDCVCDEGTCLSGLCSKTCKDSNDCAGIWPGGTNGTNTENACVFDGPVATCLPVCDQDNFCGAHLTCEALTDSLRTTTGLVCVPTGT